MYQFFIAAKTNYHRVDGDLLSYKFIIFSVLDLKHLKWASPG